MDEVFSYSPEEAGPLVGKTANWMTENARARVIPHSMVGQTIRFTPEHVREILKIFEVPAVAAARPGVSSRRKAAPSTPAEPPMLVAKPPRPRRGKAA